MFCPNCKAEFDLELGSDLTTEYISKSEVKIVFSCDWCGEQNVVTIAQEDLTQDQS